MSIHYKDYTLESISHQSPETKKWGSILHISKLESNGSFSNLPFDLKATFNTQKEVDDSAYGIGKLIIDGKHPDYKLPF